MAYNYYLMNGQNNKGNALNLVVNDKLVRNFTDISDIDLITMEIDRDKSNEIIKEYNKEANVEGIFYITSGPHKNDEVRVYAPIFKFNSAEAVKKQEQFKYFTLQRNNKIKNNKKIKLDQDREFENYIRSLLTRILDNNREILEDDTLIPIKLKEVMLQRYGLYKDYSTNSFINRPEKINFFRKSLSNYLELRVLTLEYLLAIEKDDVWIRKDIKSRAYWDNEGMVELPQIDYEGGKLPAGTITNYKQLTLTDMMRNKI